MTIRGSIDRMDHAAVEGWVFDHGDPTRHFDIDVYSGDHLVGTCRADLYREDLQAGGIGDGRHAFAFTPPSTLSQQAVSELKLRLVGTDVCLFAPNAARTTGPASNGSGLADGTLGLWIDQPDWFARMSLKYREGVISRELSLAICEFVRDGFVVFPGAVRPDMVSRLNRDIDAIWTDGPPGILMETWEPDGRQRYIRAAVEHRAGRTKLLDIYTASAAAREAIAAPIVMDFLWAIFEDKPKAFQTLSFWNGSQQAIHKDTAYVRVDPNPLSLVATWLALEDVEAGTGELEYYAGSHKAPQFLFHGRDIWMGDDLAEHEAFLSSLHDDAERYHHRRTTFLPRTGDVLVWHANLAHGGSRVTVPNRTRKSLVTHFTSVNAQPYYRRSVDHGELTTDRCVYTSQFGPVLRAPG